MLAQLEERIADTFDAADSNGSVWTINEIASFKLVKSRGSSDWLQYQTRYQTTDGYHVNPIAEGKFRIVPLGIEVQRSID